MDQSNDLQIPEVIGLKDFTAPWDDADLILISGDKSHRKLYVHKIVLALGSSYFKHLFTVPQPAEEQIDSIPQIILPESHQILSLLLQLIYPFSKPELNSHTLPLSVFCDAFDAAIKYDLLFPKSYLQQLLVSTEAGYLQENAIRVYAVTHRFNLEKEAKTVRKWVIKKGLPKRPATCEELKWLTLWDYQKLEDWIRERKADIVMAVEFFYLERERGTDPQAPELPLRCDHCVGYPSWWNEFITMVDGGVDIECTDELFEGTFLARVANNCGCSQCAFSMTRPLMRGFFADLKSEIEAMVDRDA